MPGKEPTLGQQKRSLAQTIKHLHSFGSKSNIDISVFLKFERPGFSMAKEKAARLEASLATGNNYKNANLSSEDLAAPHRAPYSLIRDAVLKGTNADIKNLVEKLSNASIHCEAAFRKVTEQGFQDLADLYKLTRMEVNNAMKKFNSTKNSLSLNKKVIARLELIKALNNLASNAPGLGPHSTNNVIVSDRLHLHPTNNTNEPTTPRTRAALIAFPNKKVATTRIENVTRVVSVTGARYSSVGPLGLQSSQFDNVQVGPRVVRGALFVDSKGQVWKPQNPFQEPTGKFHADWKLVT